MARHCINHIILTLISYGDMMCVYLYNYYIVFEIAVARCTVFGRVHNNLFKTTYIAFASMNFNRKLLVFFSRNCIDIYSRVQINSNNNLLFY